MKNKITIALLVMGIGLLMVACGNKPKEEEKAVESEVIIEEQVEEPNEVVEEEVEEVDKSSEIGEEVAGGDIDIDTMEMLKSRIENSDYIAIVKLEAGEYVIVEQLKGEITPDKILKIDGFEPEEDILVFVMDLDGMAMFTDEDSMVVLDDAGMKYLNNTRELLK